jgi:hypothetical protein
MIQEKEKMGQNVSYAMNVLGIVQKKHYKKKRFNASFYVLSK